MGRANPFPPWERCFLTIDIIIKKFNGCDLLLATLFQLFGFLLETKNGTPQHIE
jgi:hypothetical protein